MHLCFVTGSRAEYGLLCPLIARCRTDDSFRVSLVVTGSHLAAAHGATVAAIEADGLPIAGIVDMCLNSDEPVAVVGSMGMELGGLADIYAKLKPDVIVVLGDRYEILMAVSAALIFRIPVAHIHGGEITRGAFDDEIRHAITKMSHLHFTAAPAYSRRVIQMGENPKRVFTVGALGLDNVATLDLLSRDALERELNIRLRMHNLLITFHPPTLDPVPAADQFKELLVALAQRPDTFLVFTHANADPGGQTINEMLNDFVSAHRDHTVAFASLGQRRYLSLLHYMDAVVGNSSSGIFEAPAMHVSTVNIGTRQTGRIRASSVIDCQPERSAISQALDLALSEDARRRAESTDSPYGDGRAAERIVRVLKCVQPTDLIQKDFVDRAP